MKVNAVSGGKWSWRAISGLVLCSRSCSHPLLPPCASLLMSVPSGSSFLKQEIGANGFTTSSGFEGSLTRSPNPKFTQFQKFILFPLPRYGEHYVLTAVWRLSSLLCDCHGSMLERENWGIGSIIYYYK